MTRRRPPFGAIGFSLALHLGVALWLSVRPVTPPPAVAPPPLVVQLLPISALAVPVASPPSAPDHPSPPQPQGLEARRTRPAPESPIAISPPSPATSSSRPEAPAPPAAAAERVDSLTQTTRAAAAEAPKPPPPASYVSELARRLAEVKRYPDLARRRRERGAVLVHFELDRSGRLLSASIAKTSGSDALDREVMRMVSQASPFPPFPQSMAGDSESFLAPIEFSLR